MIRRRPEDVPGPEGIPDASPDGPTMEPGGEGPEGAGGALEALPEAEVLLAELEQARTEIAELNDRHLRLAAEFDNFRRRSRQEQQALRALAQADLARSVLPTLDDLARWHDIPNESTSVEALDRGLDLIRRNLIKALEEHGVRRIEAIDRPFDPEHHQGVMITEAAGPEEDQTVSRVFSDGYVLGDLLVRPAQVEVRNWQGTGAATESPGSDDVEDAGGAIELPDDLP